MSITFENVVAEMVLDKMTDESKDAVIRGYMEDYVFTRSFRSDVSTLIQARLKNLVESRLNDYAYDPQIEKCVDEIMNAELEDLGWLKSRIHEGFLKRAARKFIGW